MVGSDRNHPGLVLIYKGPDTREEQYENAYHCDTTWRECPQFGAVLRCTEAPEVGGDMIWCNMVLAYERLPEHIKAQIAGLRARHSIEATFGAAMPIEKRLALKAQYPDAEHPVVRTHPRPARRSCSSTLSRRTSPTSTPRRTCGLGRTSHLVPASC